MAESKEFPSDKADKFVVRFPEGMRESLKQAAEANNRSMNAEIVARLQTSFTPAPASKGLSEASIGDLIDEITKRYPPDYVLISIGPGAQKRSDAMFDQDD